MNLKNYFADLPNRLSANFLAFLGFISFIFLIAITSDLSLCSVTNKWYNLQNFQEMVIGKIFSNIIFLGITGTPAIFPCSILFFLIHNNHKKKFVWLYFISLLILLLLLFQYLAKHFSVRELGSSLLIVFLYRGNIHIILPLFLIVPLICYVLDKKQVLISSKYLINNKYYRFFVYVFSLYFSLCYIPFLFIILLILLITI